MKTSLPCTIMPAIDLRNGHVVRLAQGDPLRQTTYSNDPSAVAERWLEEGAEWLHVVDLDGAFGESVDENLAALTQILATGARVQFGGGLRSVPAIEHIFDIGVSRIVLGTAAIAQSELVDSCMVLFGPECVAIGVDARDGMVRIRGWSETTNTSAIDLAERLKLQGVLWMVFTDVARDGVGAGLNLDLATELARRSSLNVIVSGGVRFSEDVYAARDAGLAGVIIGRALYEGQVDLGALISNCQV